MARPQIVTTAPYQLKVPLPKGETATEMLKYLQEKLLVEDQNTRELGCEVKLVKKETSYA